MKEPTLNVPTRYLCPCCLSMAESYSKCEESRAKYEAEDRLRSGRASEPEKIKAAWERYGKGFDWERGGPVVRVPELIPFNAPTRWDYHNEPVSFTTYEFQRTVTRNKDFTVTRVHCGGLTVEETIS